MRVHRIPDDGLCARGRAWTRPLAFRRVTRPAACSAPRRVWRPSRRSAAFDSQTLGRPPVPLTLFACRLSLWTVVIAIEADKADHWPMVNEHDEGSQEQKRKGAPRVGRPSLL